jgi:uncharacterized protein
VISNLLLMSGFNHDFPATSAAIAGLLDHLGVQTEITDDINGALSSGRPYDLLTVNALRFRMEDDRFADKRAEFGLHLTEDAKAGVLDHLDRGAPLLGLHTASICFDDFPQWGEILGGYWDWSTSWHPPRGPIEVFVGDGTDNPVTAGLPGFAVTDEVYHDLVLQPDVHGLVTATAAGGPPHPVMWTRTWRNARVAYDALGHDVTSIGDPVHATLIRRLAQWLLDRPDTEIRATGPVRNHHRKETA